MNPTVSEHAKIQKMLILHLVCIATPGLQRLNNNQKEHTFQASLFARLPNISQGSLNTQELGPDKVRPR